jgi:hypothetical protein
MKNEWDEPTRLHPSADLARAAQDVDEQAAPASEGSTVLENRESLLARVQASMTVPEGASGGARPALPDSLVKALSNLPGSLPGSIASKAPGAPAAGTPSRAFDANELSPDSTPVPIGDRGTVARGHAAEALARRARQGRAKRPLRSTLARTGPFGMVAVVGFTLGLALREAPGPNADAPRADAVRVQPLAAPSSGIAIAPAPGRTAAAPAPVKAARGAEPAASGVLRVTTTPAGAAVSLDGEAITGPAPHILRLEPGRRVQLSAKLDGWQPATQQVTVEDGDHTLELKLTAQKK